jgi:flagellar basal body P-ring formation protein FlgA
MSAATQTQTQTQNLAIEDDGSRYPRGRVLQILLVATAALMLIATATAYATELQDHQQLRKLAETKALALSREQAPSGAEVRVRASSIDPRLRLAACAVEPETFSPQNTRIGGTLSIGVRCPTSPSWSLYVPVQVEITTEVLVLATGRARGEVLGADDLRLERQDLARLNGGYLTDVSEAQDMVLRRAVRPGTVLNTSMLERPRLVQRGQRVRVIAGVGSLTVSGDGEALGDAAEGDRVRVRSMASRRIVEGVVDAQGQVRADG